ncbi:hypothetical protein EV121DRAFT_205914 [Schizophyllum commune]|nr:hypothetical protein K525DRAFT_208794 [Schizophyllum commune Loenen D]
MFCILNTLEELGECGGGVADPVHLRAPARVIRNRIAWSTWSCQNVKVSVIAIGRKYFTASQYLLPGPGNGGERQMQDGMCCNAVRPRLSRPMVEFVKHLFDVPAAFASLEVQYTFDFHVDILDLVDADTGEAEIIERFLCTRLMLNHSHDYMRARAILIALESEGACQQDVMGRIARGIAEVFPSLGKTCVRLLAGSLQLRNALQGLRFLPMNIRLERADASVPVMPWSRLPFLYDIHGYALVVW